MTSLPPPGWYPDPQNAGRSWRSWDGGQWAPAAPPADYHDPYRAARAREQSGRYGRWLRYALVGNALYALVSYGVIAVLFHDVRHQFLTTGSGSESPHFSGRFVAIQLASMPLGLLGLAFTAILIAWIYHAGEFAGAMGWPATRGRTLGAFSVLIPIVNLWWPYEAIRDAYPPGADHEALLRWWLSYLIVPFVTFIAVFVVAIVGTTPVLWITIAVAAVFTTIPVTLGWGLIDDFERAVSPWAAQPIARR
jgi:hypothetical protein